MKNNVLAIALLTLLATSCGDVPVVDVQASKGDTLKENLINANRYIANSENTQIDAYASRRGWKMDLLAGGARVMEFHHGNGPQVAYEDTVSIVYNVEAIDGTTIYSNQHETIVAGHMQPNRGLDAALMTLRQGSQARVILPSEQAFGVAGDGDRIKSRLVLIYDVTVEKVNKMKDK